MFSLFLCNSILFLLDFPSEATQRISNPVNFEKVRKNKEFQYVFKTNSRGLRYNDIPAEKPVNTFRIFVSGDSFTEGEGVEDSKRFTNLLEGKYQSSDKSVMFINGGLTGAGPLTYGKLFLEVGLEYNPDALLICVFVNDVADAPDTLSLRPFDTLPSRSALKRVIQNLWPRLYARLKLYYIQKDYQRRNDTSHFVLTISEQARKQDIPQSRINRWKESLPHELVTAVKRETFNGAILSLGLLYPEYWSDSIDISNTRAKKKWKNMTNILSEILVRAKQSGLETAVILIPSPFQYDQKSHGEMNPWIITGSQIRKEWLSEETEIQKRMKRWTVSKGISFLDLTPVFREAIKLNKSLNWELDGHWNNSGHDVAANAIASWLDDQQVFSFMKSKKLK